MKLSKEFIIGTIVFITMVILFWGLNFLKGKDLLSKHRTFYAVYKNVNGLERSNPVLINGLNVGQVSKLDFKSNNSTEVVVELLLKNPINIPANSVSRIYNADMLGSKAVEIILGDSDKLAKSGDTLQSQLEESIKDVVSRELQPLKEKAENLMYSIDTVLTMMEEVFSSTNRGNFGESMKYFAKSLKNIEGITATLDSMLIEDKDKLADMLDNVNAITYNLRNNKENFNNIISNFSKLSDTLAKAKISQTLVSASKAMNEFAEIAAKINKGEGSLGMLANDDSLYIHLQKSARDLDLLLEDIKKNPKKYVNFSIF